MPQTLGQADSALTDLIILPWNDIGAFEEVMRTRGSEIAGVVMEPILCNTGAIAPEEWYLERVRELTRDNGTLLIFDEVITGFRVALGGAQSLLGVTPDLAVFAKAVAGGFPLAVLAGRRDIMELLSTQNVMHGGTYNASVFTIAAGLATLHELTRDNGVVFAALKARGEHLMDEIRKLADKHGEPMSVQGFGSVFHPAFVSGGVFRNYREFLNADAPRRLQFNTALHEEGVRVTARGTWFMSAAHTEADVEETVRAVDRAFLALR